MVSPFVKYLFLRGILPISLCFAALIRPCFVSLIYVLFALKSPFVKISKCGRNPCGTTLFITLTFLWTTVTLILQFAWLFVLIFVNDAKVINCNENHWTYILAQFGFMPYFVKYNFELVRSFLPELVAFGASLATVLILWTKKPNNEEEELGIMVEESSYQMAPVRTTIPVSDEDMHKKTFTGSLQTMADVFITLVSGFVACIHPSFMNTPYLIYFFTTVILWASYCRVGRSRMNKMKQALLFYVAIHFVLLYLYQIQTVYDVFINTLKVEQWAVIGFVPVLQQFCQNNYNLIPSTHSTYHMEYFSILIFYLIFALQYHWTKSGVDRFNRRNSFDDDDQSSSIHTEMYQSTSIVDDLNNDRNPTLLNESSPREDVQEVRCGTGIPKMSSKVYIREKLSTIFSGSNEKNTWLINNEDIINVLTFCAEHFYVIPLLCLLTWALCYHSLIGLSLLVIVCIFWGISNTQKHFLKLIPYVVFYVCVVLNAQYVFYMHLETLFGWIYDQTTISSLLVLGFDINLPAIQVFTTLLTKGALSLPLFVLLRQKGKYSEIDSINQNSNNHQGQERYTRNFVRGANGTSLAATIVDELNTSTVARAVNGISDIVTRYWIIVVILTLLLTGVEKPPNLLRQGFFVLFCLFIVLLQLSLRTFRASLYAFWTLCIFYSSIVILLIYSYEFKIVQDFITNNLGISNEWCRVIGLFVINKEFKKQSLFDTLFCPIVFVLVTMLQLKLFHDPWTKMTRLRSTESVVSTDGNRPGEMYPSTVVIGSETFIQKVRKNFSNYIEILWRIGEVHLTKLVLFILVCYASNEINAINLIIILGVTLALWIRFYGFCVSINLSIFLGIAETLIVFYNIFFNDSGPIGNPFAHLNNITCSFDIKNKKSFELWLGLKNEVFNNQIVGIIIALIAIALIYVVKYRQQIRRSNLGISSENNNIIFQDFVPSEFDMNFSNLIKFIIDYTFYKFGLEISMIFITLSAWQRMDFVSLILLICLFMFLMLNRHQIKAIWPMFTTLTVMIFPLHYIMMLGLPQCLCFEYPWMNFINYIGVKDSVVNIFRFFDLAYYDRNNVPIIIIFDFLLAFVVVRQLRIFRKEGPSHPAGDNESIYKNNNFILHKNNPYRDFVFKQETHVDYLKCFIFQYFHWISLVMVFVAGLGGTSLFALGYVIFAFVMLWKGNKLYNMQNYNNTLKLWKGLIFYNVAAIICKVAVQFIGCVVIPQSDKNLCLVRQLFSIVCVYSMDEKGETLSSCLINVSEAKIGFDTVCFAFLILQKRILHSHFFQYCMIDFRSEIILANRGAILKNQLIEKQMNEQKSEEMKKLNEIKERTAAIRKQYEERQNQEDACVFVPNAYGEAKRAGDYYMFNYDPMTEILESPKINVPEVDPGCTDPGITPAQIMHVAVDKDLDMSKAMRAIDAVQDISDDYKRIAAAVQYDDEDKDNDSNKNIKDKQKKKSQIVTICQFIIKLFESAIVFCAAELNNYTREYRYVGYVLRKEKSKLRDNLSDFLYDSSRNLSELRDEIDNQQMHCVSNENDITTMEKEAHIHWSKRNPYIRFITALGNCISAHTDLLCFFMAIVAHANCGWITMPLPLMVLFWGTLASPRPSKKFWIAMILYTQFVIITKFIVQFGDLKNEESKAFSYDTNLTFGTFLKYCGLYKRNEYAVWDVILLICLFFHRYNLRRLGFWKEANSNETFKTLPNITESSLTQGSNGEDTEVKILDSVETNCFKKFYRNLFNPKFRCINDLYTWMFTCDFIAFFIVVFGYRYFGDGGSGDIISDISSNRVPLTFVLMMLSITVMIVIDRALYLRKAIYCKFIYQIVSILFIHIWLFFVLPKITSISPSMNVAGKLLYIVKGIYFIISAWQIRNAYPKMCMGNYITHNYNLHNMVFFKIFQAVPFLYEIRTAIDWTWTDTSMPLFDYFNMENYYAIIFNLKCARTFENKYPAPRGVPKGTLIKYLMGLPMIFALILIVWCPLLAFALMNKIGLTLPPENVKMTVSIEGYPSLYTMESQGMDIQVFTNEQYDELLTKIGTLPYVNEDSSSLQKSALSYVEEFLPLDIYKLRFKPEAEDRWMISNSSLYALQKELGGNGTMNMKISIELTRKRSSTQEPIRHTTAYKIPLLPESEMRIDLTNSLSSTTDYNNPITIGPAVPEFFTVPNEGELSATKELQKLVLERGRFNNTFMNISLSRNGDFITGTAWSLQLVLPKYLDHIISPFQPYILDGSTNRTYLEFVLFVNRVYPSYINKYVSGGIIAMYIAFVLMLHRIIRGAITNSPLDVSINEIPNADLLLRMCLDIYMVREAKDFILEQDIFAKLIFLFRSSETLIRWTRHKIKQE
ncbi:Piezo family-containing protein [Strongyloides ratti]|uniref:Piezo-type mechanosensitive ion channel component n=1 Tax=Strongyloides ratti TaxID=34506 RepID=A0A090KXE5_STRRB|nr:Piezo family-containing protein [Strongyloides ratti]CEF59932.1 Piezo family-containing protein [Strongyloides ratti]